MLGFTFPPEGTAFRRQPTQSRKGRLDLFLYPWCILLMRQQTAWSGSGLLYLANHQKFVERRLDHMSAPAVNRLGGDLPPIA